MDQLPRRWKSPIEIISEADGDPPIWRGRVDFVPFKMRDGLVSVIGALFDENGSDLHAELTLRDIPISSWPNSNPAGRPKETEKHLAVLLAWCLEVNKQGGKYGLADDAIVDLFGYSGPEKIRKIRNNMAAELRADIGKDSKQIFHYIDEAREFNGNFAALIRNPVWYKDDDGFSVLGHGYLWGDGQGMRVRHGKSRVQCTGIFREIDLDDMRKKRGPVIFTVFRPGQ